MFDEIEPSGSPDLNDPREKLKIAQGLAFKLWSMLPYDKQEAYLREGHPPVVQHLAKEDRATVSPVSWVLSKIRLPWQPR